VPRAGARDDFPSAVRRHVAEEVGYTCSNPQCRAPTIGSGDPGKISRIGVAAHITAAAKGGPRYAAALTRLQRRSPENAIHLCQSCGKLVDDAASLHEAGQLREWKTRAIELRRRALACGDVDPDSTIRMDRVARHNAASYAYEAALQLQHVLFMGHVTWRIAARSYRGHEFSVKANVDAWLEEHRRKHAAVAEALQRLRSLWGHASPCEGVSALATLLNDSSLWLERFSLFLSRLISSDYLPFGSSMYQCMDTEEIIREQDIEGHQATVSAAVDRLSLWCSAHIATQQATALRTTATAPV
jgi:hypothetical protein